MKYGSNTGERVAGGWELSRQAETERQNGGANGSGSQQESAPQPLRYFEYAAAAGEVAAAQILQVQLAGEMVDA